MGRPDCIRGSSVFTLDRKAHRLLEEIEEPLRMLVDSDITSPLEESFAKNYVAFLDKVDSFHHHVVITSDYALSCTSGCSVCCYHWVEDVNSFEAAIIARFLKQHFPDDMIRIVQQCEDDCEELLRLEGLVTDTLTQHNKQKHHEKVQPDRMDILLSVFYQMRRPCPLLSAQGTCMVYQVRPLTCRMYISVSDPLRCDPDYINNATIPTCLIEFNKRIDLLLDTLHIRFSRGESENTGLRSQLIEYLAPVAGKL